jgi:hypothetical protein
MEKENDSGEKLVALNLQHADNGTAITALYHVFK